MTSYVFDIEANGLDPTEVFCIVAMDTATKKFYEFGPDQLAEGVKLLEESKELIGHNILGYDIPVVKKLLGSDLDDGSRFIVDTLVLSRLFNPTREGGHGLEGWGYRLRHKKIEFEDFESFSPEMMAYCRQDVSLNHKVYQHLARVEAAGFSKDAVALEHSVYRVMQAQRDRGFLLNEQHAMSLLAELNENISQAEKLVHKTFRPRETQMTLVPLMTKAGKVSKMAQLKGETKKVRLSDEEYEKASANPNEHLVRCDSEPFNLGSRKQIGEYLVEFGWKPTKFTPTGQPIVDEKVLSKIKDIPEAAVIAKYLMLQKRIAQITSWFKVVEDDGRVRGFVNINGAVTGRMTHSHPNMAQVPSTGSPYGKECRQCWTVMNGYKLVGIDASGLELRMLAHYMNDEGFTYELLNGDIHTANQMAAGLESRNQAKTFIYALLYGAGDAKLGTVVGGNADDGGRLRQSFFDNLPAFKVLKDRVARAAKRGYLKGLDGRKLFVRSEHAALNTLLQGAGAIVMKKALVLLNDKMSGMDAHFVANVHDEWQIEALEDVSQRVGELGVEAIEQAGLEFNLRCSLTGEYQIGDSWSETH